MTDEKFNQLLQEVKSLLHKHRATTDKSEKRILRDYIKAIVKELTKD